ncbi:hypothetical protein DCS_05003 [Drechmeria coniospora]|uniref:Uncharacterized protein n=1 Tax=Drechmeria coniospora TaxID=98403 RepID=A0A151GLL2_DRECN|nr:hypothetical protein DCS_05003 [Drechmeria coniospora]KYK57990.1 hypothetical protein DCS_05003 [Drechmeria coniospora]
MSAAAGAPPPPSGCGSGPCYGHYTDKSDRRRALGEYLVEGDSSDEEFAPPEERNVYILVEARPKVGAVPGACAVLSPEFLALGRVWACTLALAEMEPAPVRPAYTLAPVPGVVSPPAAADDNDDPNRTLVLAANALTPTRAGGRSGAVPSMQLGVFAQGVARALTGIQSDVRGLARRQQAQEGVSAELVATLAEIRRDICKSRKSRASGSPLVRRPAPSTPRIARNRSRSRSSRVADATPLRRPVASAPYIAQVAWRLRFVPPPPPPSVTSRPRPSTATDSFETLPEEDTEEDESKEDTETDKSE